MEMSAESTVSQRASTTTRWAASRSRLVVDPIWKVIDAGAYNRAWSTLTTEAELYGFVGFDMEWTTKLVGESAEHCEEGGEEASSSLAKRKPRRWTGPVATIQLSTFSCTVVVRWNHLHALVSGNASDILRDPYASVSSTWPSYRVGQKANPASLLRKIYTEVKGLIANPAVFLVGVGIHGDEVKLHRDYPKVVAQSAVELTALADACLPALVTDKSQPSSDSDARKVRTDSLRSLKKLCTALTGKELGKDMFVVMSDWGGCHGALTPLQIEYSAEDAEASYDVCGAILKGGGFLHDASSAGGAEEGHANAAPWCVARGLDCREVLACCTTTEGRENGDCEVRRRHNGAAQHGSSISAAVNAEGKAEVDWCKGRSRPYYDNINVYSPGMELVFTVDKAKADWYVNKKGLATVIEWRTPNAPESPSSNPLHSSDATSKREMVAIQLKFAPDFARYNDAHIRRNLEYFKQPKENICVVCGEGGSLVRFAVVPLMYRRFFPSVYMSHNSYDLLLLCPRCFAKANGVYNRLRLRVAEDFGVPLVHLRGEQREAYVKQVQKVREEMAAFSHAYEVRDSGEDADPLDTPGKDCDLHPRLKLQGMLDYLTLTEHREVLDTVFSYAKALHAHYQSPTQRNSGANTAPGDDSTAEVTLPSPSPQNKRRARRHGHHVADSRAVEVTAIPDERRRMMADFLCTNAPIYPFYADHGSGTAGAEQGLGQTATSSRDGALDGHAVQSAVFSDARGGPASSAGVFFILTGCVAEAPSLKEAEGETGTCQQEDPSRHQSRGNTSRGVLARYWLNAHPELVSTLPTVTRLEERQRDHSSRVATERAEDDADGSSSPSADSPMDNDSSGVPYVDSHAFLVVQMLLKKYEGVEHCQKTAEHAVGQFIYRWRSSFVEGMKPQHLPHGWVPEDGILR
ncbi:hypothetical protein ABB37_09164 [Leptomonas pyrrhocoris]|uniref:Uncharacterized protein n=1 Tax=Leptomonas pyrrhocoris TaxID=157538 RepID=A0A0N0VD28_LEPPY|nr:hypothetical protein ABB37_09164 [Leptomonas pyrrhocoris]KPA74501.1 hypothetical protein ABB37_09164 [Leptomonas pyrrhocoris]|eukprot:XP_015652940.1 hypothetical protein ABB37_09164 [Leptomonas pyrrhocoris]